MMSFLLPPFSGKERNSSCKSSCMPFDLPQSHSTAGQLCTVNTKCVKSVIGVLAISEYNLAT